MEYSTNNPEFRPVVRLLDVDGPAMKEFIDAVCLQVRITTERELRQKDRWLTTEQACEIMNIGPKALASKRDVPKSVIRTNGKVNKDIRYLESSIYKYIESNCK